MHLAFLLPLLLTGAARGQDPQAPVPTVVVEGSVVNRTGTGLPGVQVEVVRDGAVLATTTTDAAGKFRFPAVPVGPGRYEVRASLQGFGRASRPVSGLTTHPGASFSLTLRLGGETAAPHLPMGDGHPSNQAVIQVFYATDRQRDPGATLAYTATRGAGLSFGRFDVSIPRDHRMATIERPSIWRLEFREDPEKHFVIVARKSESEDEFHDEVRRVVAASPKKEAFVFIHGYNVDFEDAVYRTAQLAYDLGFPGAPILYSWPSNGRLFEYTGDLNNSEWTVPHLRGFLESLARSTGAETIHVIAHSMGNRALAGALNLMATAGTVPERRFREVVMCAPDIDAAIFKQLAQAMESTASRITLYASANDKALQASKRDAVNGYPRAGDASAEVVVVPGVDTIDASAVDTDFLGHSYFGDQRSVLTDLFALLNEGKAPAERFGLHAIAAGSGTYWRFEP